MPAADGLARRIARKVLTETLRVRRGDNVTIESWSTALPWAVPFVDEARRLGAHPMMLYEDEPSFWRAFETGRVRTTGEVGAHEWAALEGSDAYVFFFGPSEWPRFRDLAAARRAGHAAYNPEWYRRAATAKVRGARMYIGRTSELSARRWEVNLRAWRSALERASLADPAAMREVGRRVGSRLRHGRRARLTHPNGTELEFALGRSPVELDDGVVDDVDIREGHNVTTVPGGVVTTALDPTSAQGTIVSNRTVYPNSGPAHGIRWTLRDGRLASHAYARGGRPFERELARAPKGAGDRLSILSVGLNPRLAGCPHQEDQELGTVVLGVGGNVFLGGKNPGPQVGWTAIHGATLEIDGRPVLRRGRLV